MAKETVASLSEKVSVLSAAYDDLYQATQGLRLEAEARAKEIDSLVARISNMERAAVRMAKYINGYLAEEMAVVLGADSSWK